MIRRLTRKPFSKMDGLTLLETMFALAVGALVLIGAVIFYMSTKTSATTSKVITDMNAITAAADTYIASGNSASNLSDAMGPLQTAGLLPKPMNDPYGQEYTATVAANSNQIVIAIPGLPKADQGCTNIATAVGANSSNGSSQGVTTGDDSTYCSFSYTL